MGWTCLGPWHYISWVSQFSFNGLAFHVMSHHLGPLHASFLCKLSWTSSQLSSETHHSESRSCQDSGPPKGTAAFLQRCSGQRKSQASPDSGEETPISSIQHVGRKGLLLAILGDFSTVCIPSPHITLFFSSSQTL